MQGYTVSYDTDSSLAYVSWVEDGQFGYGEGLSVALALVGWGWTVELDSDHSGTTTLTHENITSLGNHDEVARWGEHGEKILENL